MFKMLACCMNWKVIGTLAVTGLGVWVIAPNLVAGLLPILVLLACPLSMLLMMPMMMKDRQGSNNTVGEKPQRITLLPQARLSREEQVAELKAQLGNLQLQQQAMVQEINQLENENAPVLREAAAVVRAAGEEPDHRN